MHIVPQSFRKSHWIHSQVL